MLGTGAREGIWCLATSISLRRAMASDAQDGSGGGLRCPLLGSEAVSHAVELVEPYGDGYAEVDVGPPAQTRWAAYLEALGEKLGLESAAEGRVCFWLGLQAHLANSVFTIGRNIGPTLFIAKAGAAQVLSELVEALECYRVASYSPFHTPPSSPDTAAGGHVRVRRGSAGHRTTLRPVLPRQAGCKDQPRLQPLHRCGAASPPHTAGGLTARVAGGARLRLRAIPGRGALGPVQWRLAAVIHSPGCCTQTLAPLRPT